MALPFRRMAIGPSGQQVMVTAELAGVGRQATSVELVRLREVRAMARRIVDAAVAGPVRQVDATQPPPIRVEHVRQRLQTLRQAVDDSYLEMGLLLREVHAGTYYRTWGFESFDAYIDADLQMRRRKVFYLISVAEAFERLGVNAEERRQITWSNARELAAATRDVNTGQPRHITDEERTQLLEQGRNLTSTELRNWIRQGRGEPPITMVVFSCQMTPDAKTVLDQALETVRRQADAQPDELSKGRLLELMAAEFLAGAHGIRVAHPPQVVEAPEVRPVIHVTPTGEVVRAQEETVQVEIDANGVVYEVGREVEVVESDLPIVPPDDEPEEVAVGETRTIPGM